MTDIRWCFLLFCFLFPTATDLLFQEVSVRWIIGGTVFALLWNLFCGVSVIDVGVCLIPGVLLWILSRLSKGIGTGDVLAAFLLGMICGLPFGLEILFGGSVLCFLGQIIRKQKQMPFVPWLLASAYINWCLSVILI